VSGIIILDSPESIDTGKNGVIEASAGTGKTYTISKLFTKIVREGRASHNEILVLTFTEKATEELKVRIREEILNQSSISENLKKAYLDFDSSNIFTIHGFCNYIIKNYPFDTGVNISCEPGVVPRKKILRKIMIKEIDDFANRFLTSENDAVIEPDRVEYEVNAILENFVKEKGHKIFIDGIDEEFESVDALFNYLESHRENTNFQSFLEYYLILRFFEEEKKFKQEFSIITYDDMIKSVWYALENNSKFASSLSSKYKYIIVDEFQDTDLLQWKIFEKLCFGTDLSSRIFIVGDPKQAIYNFRGGDIYTYLKAKQRILENGGQHYLLKKNFRTTKQLGEKLEIFFKSHNGEINNWFATDGDNNGLVQSDEEISVEYQKDEGYDDKIEPFNAFVLNVEKPSDAFEIWLKFVVNEIKRLVYSDVYIYENGERRKILPSDILILCRTSEKAMNYEKELNNTGIKAKFFEREGSLFSGYEVLTIKVLLYYLTYPDELILKKRLLLSEIFDLDLTEVINIMEKEDKGFQANLLEKWILLARDKKWGLLFDSVFYESEMFYRMFNKYSKNIAMQRVLRYLQIAQIIKDVASRKNLNISGVLMEFENLIKNESRKVWVEDDANYVKILTIHSAKGLEGNIVFIGDGFTKKNKYDYYKYYYENVYRYVIKNNNHNTWVKELHNKAENEEKKRLYYVAFTRAKYSLYFCIANVSNTRSRGSWDVMSKEIKERVLKLKEKGLLEVKSLPLDHSEGSIYLKEGEEVKDIQINLLEDIDLSKSSYISSFSGIKKKLYGDKGEVIIEEIGGEDEEENSSYAEELLPGGVDVGTLLHSILEEIDFTLASGLKDAGEFLNIPSVGAVVEKWLRRFIVVDSSFEKVKERVAELVFNTLTTEIFDGFKLCNLKKEERLSELDFYYRLDNKYLLTGAIDLVFKYNGKFYIIDWKSNILDEYEGDSFYNFVEEHYGLQYKIYMLATLEYLKCVYGNFKGRFGGVLYIFLRGIKAGSKSGIFFKEFDYNLLCSIISEVKESYRNALEIDYFAG